MNSTTHHTDRTKPREKLPTKKKIPAPPDSKVTRKRPRLAPVGGTVAAPTQVDSASAPTPTLASNRADAQDRVRQNLGMLESVIEGLNAADPARCGAKQLIAEASGAKRLIAEALEDLQALAAAFTRNEESSARVASSEPCHLRPYEMHERLEEIARIEPDLQCELMQLTEEVDSMGKVRGGPAYEELLRHSKIANAALARLAGIFVHVVTIREHVSEYRPAAD